MDILHGGGGGGVGGILPSDTGFSEALDSCFVMGEVEWVDNRNPLPFTLTVNKNARVHCHYSR